MFFYIIMGFITFWTWLYRQVVGIPMDLWLRVYSRFYYERDFMGSLSDDIKAGWYYGCV